jgi:hypothetical protein
MLSTREKFFATLTLFFLITGVLGYTTLSALKFTSSVDRLSEKMVISRDYYLRASQSCYSAADKNLATAWTEDFIPDSDSPLFITIESGLTHFPGLPPVENLPKELYIWSGNQTAGQLFQDYARPKKINLIFLTQEKVDVDREFRLPGPLEVWAEKKISLPDSPGKIIIPLDFLKSKGPSAKFPKNVHQIWIRIEIESVYPGKKFPNTIAVTEIDYKTPIPEHSGVTE